MYSYCRRWRDIVIMYMHLGLVKTASIRSAARYQLVLHLSTLVCLSVGKISQQFMNGF